MTEFKKTRGGKGRGQGRHKLPSGEKRKPVMVTLPPALLARIRGAAKNVSRFVEDACTAELEKETEL